MGSTSEEHKRGPEQQSVPLRSPKVNESLVPSGRRDGPVAGRDLVPILWIGTDSMADEAMKRTCVWRKDTSLFSQCQQQPIPRSSTEFRQNAGGFCCYPRVNCNRDQSVTQESEPLIADLNIGPAQKRRDPREVNHVAENAKSCRFGSCGSPWGRSHTIWQFHLNPATRIIILVRAIIADCVCFIQSEDAEGR